MKVRPSGWWYALVPIVFLTGVAFGVAGVVAEGIETANSFSMVGPDGRGSIQLDAGEQATVFALQARREDIDRPRTTVEVTGPDGTDVPFDLAGSDTQTIRVDGTSGVDLGTFEAQESGTHQVHVDFGPPAVGTAASDQPRAAVGRLDWQELLERLLRPIVVGAIAALAAWIVLLTMRGASKRRLRANGSPSDPSGRSGPFV